MDIHELRTPLKMTRTSIEKIIDGSQTYIDISQTTFAGNFVDDSVGARVLDPVYSVKIRLHKEALKRIITEYQKW